MAPSVVFMGTPDFSVPPLKALHRQGYDIRLVVTQPDRPQGRGRKMIETPVKQTALALGLPVLQPLRINEAEVVDTLRSLAPDFFVVTAFGQFLSNELLRVPEMGSVNIHASLLPAYRGASPIHRAIINGESETGITTMLMDQGMDSGDILMQAALAIRPDDTAESLHDRLSALGAELIIDTLNAMAAGSLTPRPQDPSRVTFAPMLSKEDGHLPWTRTARELDCFVRGMTPWPGAFTFFDDKRLKIFAVEAIDSTSKAEPGTVLESGNGRLVVQTGRGALSIQEIQGASGKRLPIADFLRGFSIPADRRFT
ncbi:methionyl-tRNA formyltransferase [Desulfatiferula olefinivorans]